MLAGPADGLKHYSVKSSLYMNRYPRDHILGASKQAIEEQGSQAWRTHREETKLNLEPCTRIKDREDAKIGGGNTSMANCIDGPGPSHGCVSHVEDSAPRKVPNEWYK